MSLVKVEKVERNFTQGEITVRALRGISMEIEQGEFTALVGPSGSGKSTLLNCIGALDKPTAGKITVAGRDLADLDSGQLADFRLRDIGFVFQAYNLVPVLTALENVEFVLMLQGVDRKERLARAQKILDEMDLGELSGRFPRELSGGQQQRVAVARALVSQPNIVLADEPTANLDSANADLLLDMMADMCARHNTAFLFSTHDARVMARARRLIRLRDGAIESEEIKS